MKISLIRDEDGSFRFLVIQVPIPFGHGYKLNYVVHLLSLDRQIYDLVEVTLEDPEEYFRYL